MLNVVNIMDYMFGELVGKWCSDYLWKVNRLRYLAVGDVNYIGIHTNA
jgi:hypothetical protein